MRRMSVLIALLPLLMALVAADPAAACGTTVLEVGVRDLNDKPAARIAFDIDVDGAQRTMATDAGGLLTLTCLEAKAVRIVAARTAAGQPLTMDENTPGGGLTIPLLEGQTQRLPLRLTDTLLFVEPVAESEQSTVFSATPAAAPPAAAPLPSASVAAPSAASTPPIPTPARPFWFWWVVVLVLGVPAALGAILWLRGAAARRRRAR
jgi:hypothetical protein